MAREKLIEAQEGASNGRPGRPALDEIASARRDIDLFPGFIEQLPNPDVIFREAPDKGIRIYNDIARDPHVRSVFQTRRLAVVGKDWEVQAASEDAADKRVRDVVADALARIPGFERARYDLLDGVLKGFAVAEIMWGIRDGLVVPVALKRRGQHRFSFDFDGRLRLLTRENMITGELLPERKFLLFQYDASDENPYGIGVGQSLYWPWWFKKHGIKFWLLFLERFGMPTIEGKYPPGTTKEQQDLLLSVLRSIQQDMAYKIPSTMEINLKEAQRGSTVALYDPFIALMNAEMSKAVLGQTATTEGTPGKLGSEEARADVRQDYVEADADLQDEVFAGQLIRWIVDFNFGPDVPAPWFTTGAVKGDSELDLWRRSFRDSNLQRMGLKIPARYAYDTYLIPQPEGDEEVLEATLTQPFDPAASAGGQFGEDAPPADALPGFVELVRLEGAALRRAPRAAAAIRRAIAAHLDQKKSLDGALTGLAEAVRDEDLEDLVTLVRDTMVTGELLGRAHVAVAAKRARREFQAEGRDPGLDALPPEEALAFFRQRVSVTQEEFERLLPVIQARAFTVARVFRRDAVEFIRAELERALREGETFAQFRQRLDASWDRFGITELKPHHLRTVFQTNLATAYSAGRFEQLQDPEIAEDFPFFQYHAVLDDRVRPNHAAMHGVIRRREDPVWQTWWPPNGFRCRCSVTAISRVEAERLGLTETSVPAVQPDPGFEGNPAQTLRAGL